MAETRIQTHTHTIFNTYCFSMNRRKCERIKYSAFWIIYRDWPEQREESLKYQSRKVNVKTFSRTAFPDFTRAHVSTARKWTEAKLNKSRLEITIFKFYVENKCFSSLGILRFIKKLCKKNWKRRCRMDDNIKMDITKIWCKVWHRFNWHVRAAGFCKQ
jgi:hypothetical protein